MTISDARRMARTLMGPHGDTWGVYTEPHDGLFEFEMSKDYKSGSGPYTRFPVCLEVAAIEACKSQEELREYIELELAIGRVRS